MRKMDNFDRPTITEPSAPVNNIPDISPKKPSNAVLTLSGLTLLVIGVVSILMKEAVDSSMISSLPAGGIIVMLMGYGGLGIAVLGALFLIIQFLNRGD